jgi:hypothetical protein
MAAHVNKPMTAARRCHTRSVVAFIGHAHISTASNTFTAQRVIESGASLIRCVGSHCRID